MIDVLLATNENYVIGAITMMVSVLESSGHDWRFHVVDTGITEESKDRICAMIKDYRPAEVVFHPFDDTPFRSSNSQYGNFSTYSRFLSPLLIPNKVCVYIDTDILVFKDLRELIGRCDFESDIVAWAVQDPAVRFLKNDCPFEVSKSDRELRYINAGFSVYNLDRMREMQIYERAVEIIKKDNVKLEYLDQTIFNYLCRGQIEYLDDEWNYLILFDEQRRNLTKGKDKDYHFVGPSKPWHRPRFSFAARYWMEFYRDKVKKFYPMPDWMKRQHLFYAVFDLPFSVFALIRALILGRKMQRIHYRAVLRGYLGIIT